MSKVEGSTQKYLKLSVVQISGNLNSGVRKAIFHLASFSPFMVIKSGFSWFCKIKDKKINYNLHFCQYMVGNNYLLIIWPNYDGFGNACTIDRLKLGHCGVVECRLMVRTTLILWTWRPRLVSKLNHSAHHIALLAFSKLNHWHCAH